MNGIRRAVRHLGALVLVALIAPSGVSAQAGRSATEEGNRLYREGRFGEAHDKYLEALREAPDSPIIRFNDGSALYQGQQYEGALEAFQDAIESGDPRLLGDAWYNVGNALFRQGQLEPSLEAFKQALRTNPADLDAKHNLERVLEQMQEQEQDQQGEGDDQNQDDQDQDQEQEQQQQPEDQQQGGEQGDEEQQGEPPPNPDEQPDDPQQDQGDGEDEPEEGEDAEGSPPPPGEMTREEAERLLEAIQEDQDEVNRQPRTPVRGTRPRRDW